MPLYRFMCSACPAKFNRTYKMTDDKKPTCPNCGSSKVYRIFESTPIVYKTGGFYNKK